MIHLETEKDGFSLSYKGRKLLSHSRRNPCLALGRGEGKYGMTRGHFRVRDRVLERVACREFSIGSEGSGPRSVSPGLEGRPALTIEFPGLITLVLEEIGGRLALRFAGFQPRWNRLWLDLRAEPEEHIYGCGEQYSELDLRGKKLPVWSQEQGIGRGRGLITLLAELRTGSGGHWYSSYFPLAVILSSRNWYCVGDSPGYAEFDFRGRDQHRLEFWQIPERLLFDCRASAPELVGSLSELMGRQPLRLLR